MNPAQGDGDTHQHELVIIRRRSNGEEAPHKGGVWKIAHADFMTALMAFFLVMWLITATDDKTITGVANYFNPMRLSDSNARPKGIHNMEPGSSNKEGSSPGTSDAGKHSGSRTGKGTEGPNNAEAALFGEPYEVLDKLAAEAGKGPPALHLTERGNPLGHHTGEAFRDPFDPDSRFDPRQSVEPDAGAGSKDAAAGGAPNGNGLGHAEPQTVPPPADGAPASNASTDLSHPIQNAVKATGFHPIPGIDVRTTDEGLLISISDQPDFEMFGIASARPKPEVVVLLEKIGKILMDRPESVVIRGHTDGRPYRGDYDNWRLSTARAQMAYYMLMRSGIPPTRVARIEGHADHSLKNTGDPLAAENRRIEILLAKGKP